MWLRPGSGHTGEPRWGHVDGLQIGTYPPGGPRGLLRVYAPYLGHLPDRVLNFVAVEPIPLGGTERGFSELERSELDGVQGKRIWSSHDPSDGMPCEPADAVPGIVDTVDGVERLTVYLHVERFENGAEVVVRVRFRADRPREVELASLRRDESVELTSCVLTATMGNYARLRRLHLADRVVTPAELWPGFGGTGFAEHARFGPSGLRRSGRAVVAYATPDEPAPQNAHYSDDTAPHWHYSGTRAVQGWRVDDPSDDVQVLVNCRWAYWASAAPIPGGPAYENVEIVEPFRDGQTFVYWAEPFADEGEVDRLAGLHSS